MAGVGPFVKKHFPCLLKNLLQFLVLLKPVLPERVVLLGEDLDLHDELVVELHHRLLELSELAAHLVPLLGQPFADGHQLSAEQTIVN